jgi:hypothetical protein
MLLLKLQPRCIGIRRAINDPGGSQHDDEQTAARFDRFFCVGLTRERPGNLPLCAPGLRVLVIRRQRHAERTNNATAGDFGHVFNRDSEEPLEKHHSTYIDYIMRHWKRQITVSMRMGERAIWLIRSDEFWSHATRRFTTLPTDMLRFISKTLSGGSDENGDD